MSTFGVFFNNQNLISKQSNIKLTKIIIFIFTKNHKNSSLKEEGDKKIKNFSKNFYPHLRVKNHQQQFFLQAPLDYPKDL